MTDRRKPAHPKTCDCPLCVTGYVGGVSTVHSCRTCRWDSKCDARLKIVSLTCHLMDLGFLDSPDTIFENALAPNCKKREGK